MEDLDTFSCVALIPAYNEAQRISPVIQGAKVFLPVVAVDDGSKDSTAQVAETAGAAVLRQVRNQGKGAALRTGMRWALDQGYQTVLTLDADGQHDPAEIPAFLDRYRATHADLIIGARSFDHMPLVRRVANTLGRWSFSWALGESIQDNQSGYRFLSRRMIKAILNSQEQGFEFEVEMIVTCVQQGYVLDWVPIQTIYGDQGSHIDPLHHATQFGRVVFQTRQRMRGHRRTKPAHN